MNSALLKWLITGG